MKRILTLVVAAAFALTAYPVFAAVNSTPHDFTGGATAYGLCEVCHVPHAASAQTAKRLWRETRTIAAGNPWTASVVGDLCGTCHMSDRAIATSNGDDPPHVVEGTAYDNDPTDGKASHDRLVANLTNTPASGGVGDTPITANALTRPYMNQTRIECTSCHNPHDNTVRPFLRRTAANEATISAVCGDCHDGRYNAGNVSSNNTVGLGSRSTHPVDVAYADLAGNNSGSGTTQLHTPAANLRTAVTLTAWSLRGGKFQDSSDAPKTNTTVGATDKIGCQTCHQIHNPDTASDNSDTLYLLAVNNVPSLTGDGAPLCEGCHGGGNQATVSTMFVGGPSTDATLDDHPIDIDPNGSPALVNWSLTTKYERIPNSAINKSGAIWPYPVGGTDNYSIPGTNEKIGRIVCTSCHSAHNAKTATSLNREGGNAAEWCYSCHSESDTIPGNHHSTLSPSGTGGNWNGLSQIDCTDCHGGIAGNLNAHMGFFAIQLVGDNTNSELCIACHADDGLVNTTDNPVSSNLLSGVADVPNAHLTDLGTVSHYLGAFDDNQNSINVKEGYWMAATNNGRGSSYSKYGGNGVDTRGADAPTVNGSSTMICESCHSILFNAGDGSLTGGWAVNLLLQNYEDNTVGTSTGATPNTNVGGSSVGSGLCVACHNQNLNVSGMGNSPGFVSDSVVNGNAAMAIVPANMHPMTGWSITRAKDANRTTGEGWNLETDIASGSYADQTNAPITGGNAPGGGSYDGADAMSCDGCHRPHSALGTWSVTYRGAGIAVILEQGGAADEYGALCQQCHNM